MTQELDALKQGSGSKTPPKSGKKTGRNALILAFVILLGAILPSEYKAYTPLLFLIPFIVDAIYKLKKTSEEEKYTRPDQTYSPKTAYPRPSSEPFIYKPKDPKDPRRYKPIG